MTKSKIIGIGFSLLLTIGIVLCAANIAPMRPCNYPKVSCTGTDDINALPAKTYLYYNATVVGGSTINWDFHTQSDGPETSIANVTVEVMNKGNFTLWQAQFLNGTLGLSYYLLCQSTTLSKDVSSNSGVFNVPYPDVWYVVFSDPSTDESCGGGCHTGDHVDTQLSCGVFPSGPCATLNIVPGAPANYEVENSWDDMKISWSTPSGNAPVDEYLIYRITGLPAEGVSGVPVLIGTIPVDNPYESTTYSFSDTEGIAGQMYAYGIIATNNKGIGPSIGLNSYTMYPNNSWVIILTIALVIGGSIAALLVIITILKRRKVGVKTAKNVQKLAVPAREEGTPQVKICPACGAQLQSRQKFCDKCGSKQ